MLALLALLVFPAAMAFAAASDLVTMTIPNRLTILIGGGFLTMAALSGLSLPEIGWHLGVGLLVLVVGFGLFSRGWIGGGDAKLAAATALWLGTDALVDYALLAGIFGGALTLAILAMRHFPLPAIGARLPWFAKLQDPQTGVPYGIALAAAALVTYPHTEMWRLAFQGA